MINKISRYLSPLEIAIAGLSFSCIIGACIIKLINPIHYQYVNIISMHTMIYAALFLIILLIAAGHLKSFAPFSGKILMTVVLTALPFISGFSGEGPILLTPFHTIDSWLLHVDKLMGFSTNDVMNYVHQYPWLVKLLTAGYESLFPWQMLFAPLLLTLLGHYDRTKRLTFAMILGSITAGMIYFIWPTTGPASVVHNQFFLESSHELVARFQSIHKNLMPTTTHGLGVIAFPSCHVLYATIITLMLRPVKYLFYPAIAVNAVLIMATMALGYHYLADVIAGIIIAIITLQLTKFKCLSY